MWPRSAETLYRGLDPRVSRHNEDNFWFYYVRMLERVADCLEFNLGIDLGQDQRLFPGMLLFNYAEDPLWCDLGAGYGAGQTVIALKALKKSRGLLSNSAKLREKHPAQAQKLYDQAIDQILDLPSPASIFLNDAMSAGSEQFTLVVDDLFDLYTQQLIESRKWGGNARAKRIAIRLRAITEQYTDHQIFAGPDPQTASGAFVECLQQIYEVIGIKVHFYRYARFACKRAADDRELAGSFKVLQSFSQ